MVTPSLFTIKRAPSGVTGLMFSKPRLELGEIEGRRRGGWTEDEMGWMASIQWTWLNELFNELEQPPGHFKGQGSLACCKTMGLQRVGHGIE